MAHEAVLLTDAGLILEPDFDRAAFWQIGQMGALSMKAKVFISCNRLGILGRMVWPRRDMREAEFAKKRPYIALAIIDAEPLGNDLLEINTPPTNDPVSFSVGAYFDDLRELGLLHCRKAWVTAAPPCCPGCI
jgi:hypothetical protein